jgi:hypothetical protein
MNKIKKKINIIIYKNLLRMTLKIIALSLLANMIFAWIDSAFDIFVEEDLNDILNEFKHINIKNAKIITNGISASISMLITRIIEKQIAEHSIIIESPYLPAIGILLGTIVIFCIHLIFYRNKETKTKKE